MKTPTYLLLGIPLVTADLTAPAAAPPELEIANARLRVKLFLPDPNHGYYRGTRFDWSGVIGSLQFAGNEFYPPWFQRVDPDVHDFIYAGADIVAGPCTAITGPAEEFVADGKALGFDEAKPDGTFIKIGVGVLRRPDEKPYDPYRLYSIVDGGRWTITRRPDAVEFRQEVSDPATGYAYDYRKIVSLTDDQAQVVIGHSLRNTGQRPLQTSVYNHNFLYLNRQAPGPGLVLTTSFPIQADPALDPAVAEVEGKQLVLKKTLTNEERVYAALSGFGPEAGDYDFRVESREAGVGVRIRGDRPLSRVALWVIRAPHSIEPFLDLDIEPNAEVTWRLQYDYYSLARGTP